MAGHSKWKNIRHTKAKQDARKGKIFTKLIREITVAARTGGSEPSSNSRLRTAVQAALGENMTRDTIDRAIARGLGEEAATQDEELRYEGYAPGGVAVMVDCMTNNRNRTAGEVRHMFVKYSGNLGAEGSVGYLFTRRGVLRFAEGINEDRLLEVALDAGADDVVTQDDGSFEVLTHPDHFNDVQEKIIKAGLKPEQAEITEMPSTYALLDDVEIAQKCLKLIDGLEELDDVQNVYTNVDIADDIAGQLE
jgi:YebC/PmpR family DNA-binding regulatory protein